MFQPAQNRLESVPLKKVGGCIDADAPDNNDWLIGCDSQKQVCRVLHEIPVFPQIVAKQEPLVSVFVNIGNL